MMCVKRLMPIFLMSVIIGFIVKSAFSIDESVITQFNSTFNRKESKVMVRLITKPTLANLDFASYDKNPLLYRQNFPKLIQPQKQIGINELHFGESVVPSSICDRIDQIPLNQNDKASPMAWTPMIDFLADWDYDQMIELMKTGVNVSQQKWGNNDIGLPIQQITTAYINTLKDEIWVKIEFEPNANFIDNIDDEDNDGFKEIYGLIDKSKYSKQLLDHLKSKYMSYELNDEEVKDYYYKLSAKWYESVKTETLDMNVYKQFPNDKTEPEIINELKGLKIDDTTAIIRGNPYGSPVYNIFIVKINNEKSGENQENPTLSDNIQRLNDELKRWGEGSWDKWVESLTGFHQDVETMLKERPAELKGFVGKDGFLFFRGSLEYLLSGDLRKQENNRDPYPAIVDYKNQLKAKGIDFLFVVIPAKTEIFPDKITNKAPDGTYVTPYTRKLMLELESAGVEVVDLLPALIDARKQDESIYMKQDTHWSNSAVQLSAKIISERIKEYSWYKDVCPKPIAYKTKEAKFTRSGDIRDMLPDNEKLAYRPMSLTAQQVLNPDGSFYKDNESSPIVILGDS
ncbi:MAG: hypothetical protein QG641_34, partial [Candidatus Poribacteria bacterium]|nr:hypothetical protein [Candidatus Poribacteria bacterium]